MRLVHSGCYGCRYNRFDGICANVGECKGVEPYPTYITTTEAINKEINQTLPDEIEINGIKYRRVEE